LALPRRVRPRRIGRKDLSGGDRLLGAIELARGGAGTPFDGSPILIDAAIAQVGRELAGRDLSAALPPRRHALYGRLAALPVAAAIICAVLFPAASANTLRRFGGVLEVPRYTFVRVAALPEPWIVPRGEPLSLAVRLLPETLSTPDAAELRIPGAPPLRAAIAEGAYRFAIPPRTAAEVLRLRVGDLTREIPVRPIARPELVELGARIVHPEYLGIVGTFGADLRSGGAAVLTGSGIALTARATRPLVRARVDGRDATVVGERIEAALEPIVGDRAHELEWKDEHGLAGARPARVLLRAQSDEPPTVGVRELPREAVVLDTETVAFRIDAGDDYGVREVSLVWEGVPERISNPTPSRGGKRIAAGTPAERTIAAPATFCAAREGIPPQTIVLRATARDAFPGRAATESAPFTLHVLAPEEHMVWLTGELGRWLREAAEVRDRERDLHRANQELRALPPEELDRPSIRKRLEEQAIAERANARRLERLGERGDELLARAARNPEFNARTMEEWSERVRSLREIAAARMPSVADLLAQASSAAEGSGAGETASVESPPRAGGAGSPDGAAAETARVAADAGSAAPPSADGAERAETAGEADEEALARLEREREWGSGVELDRSASAAGASANAPETPRAPPAPSVTDRESTAGAAAAAPSPPSAGGGGGAGLVTTTVPGGAWPPPPANAAGEKLESAIAEQSELLARFDEVVAALGDVLRDLEGSTFVKRLKAASREQSRIAGVLPDVVVAGFGRAANALDAAFSDQLVTVAALEWSSGDRLTGIQGDLEAFVLRGERAAHRQVLEQMKETGVTAELNAAARAIERNHSGDSIARAELWADTLDRWADELVGPG
jgi:hypothetical protein